MTMVEIIAIITTGILCVLCVVCVIAVIGNQRQARANSKAIQDIEKSLSSFGDSIKSKTDQLIDHMDRQQVDELQTQRLEFLEQEVLRLSELEKKGHAYRAVNGDVYFRTRRCEEYGKLSHQPIDDLESGARISVGEDKEDPLDFALWKAAKPGEPSWESPWSNGRPGWHSAAQGGRCESAHPDHLQSWGARR